MNEVVAVVAGALTFVFAVGCLMLALLLLVAIAVEWDDTDREEIIIGFVACFAFMCVGGTLLAALLHRGWPA